MEVGKKDGGLVLSSTLIIIATKAGFLGSSDTGSGMQIAGFSMLALFLSITGILMLILIVVLVMKQQKKKKRARGELA